MKEKIVIDEDFYVKHFQDREKDFNEEQLCSGGNPEEWWHYKLEQVPKTFKELKELCKGLKEEDILVTNDCIVFRDLNFYKSGIICVPNSEYFSISTNRTPAQMWNIIKNLIGEE